MNKLINSILGQVLICSDLKEWSKKLQLVKYESSGDINYNNLSNGYKAYK